MDVRSLAFSVFLLLWSSGPSYGQDTARIKLSAANIDAGDPLSSDLTLDPPSPCDTGAMLLLVMPDNTSEYFVLRGQIAKGQTEAHLSTQVGRDRAPGTYRTTELQLFACPGYDKTRILHPPDVEVVSVTVRAIQDSTVFPSRAALTLSVSQKQFFDTKIAELNKLDQLLTTKIENRASDLPDLRLFLTQIVDDADRDLSITEGQYREQILKSKETPLPAFFADFHYQYQTLRIQLRAPIQGVGRTTRIDRPARLIYVQQLKTHEPAQPKMPLQNTTGVYPAIVIAVRSVMGDNKAAYSTVKTGRVNTVVSITSHPTGAHIQYRYSYETTYRDYSALTDVQRAKLELVSYTFKFHKDGCSDEPIFQLDPYQDPDPTVDVEFQECRHR